MVSEAKRKQEEIELAKFKRIWKFKVQHAARVGQQNLNFSNSSLRWKETRKLKWKTIRSNCLGIILHRRAFKIVNSSKTYAKRTF